MNQQKTGEFLKCLRGGKRLTQEQLAEHFYVSTRTVSRWETGSNMPNVDMLVGVVPESICSAIIAIVRAAALVGAVALGMYTMGVFDQIGKHKRERRENSC